MLQIKSTGLKIQSKSRNIIGALQMADMLLKSLYSFHDQIELIIGRMIHEFTKFFHKISTSEEDSDHKFKEPVRTKFFKNHCHLP